MIVVELTITRDDTVILLSPENVVSGTKLVPVSVATITVPTCPELGLIEINVGGGNAGNTFIVTELLVPPAVVKLTARGPVAAPGAIVSWPVCVPASPDEEENVIPGPALRVKGG